MFFGYPIEATDENWLHDCLSLVLRTVHVSLDSGQPLPVWPEVVPEEHREQLKRRHGLKSRLEGYQSAVSQLGAQDRLRIQRCLAEQNEISLLVSCDGNCESAADLPEAIQKPIQEMFEFAFGLLSDLGIRDKHYKAIYSAQKYHVCPFCGCEYFDAPGAPREDLDHYLPISIYPFAGVNLRNLVPMGMKCNERYKKAQDILQNASGVRRRSFDPYGVREINVSLVDSVPFSGESAHTPDWKIDFNPDSPECSTWDDVFQIRERISRDVLAQSYPRWLGDFAEWFVKRIGFGNVGDEQIKEGLQIYAEDMDIMGFRAKDFLRGAVFRMLHAHCGQGDARLLSFMRTLVTNAAS